MRKLLTMLGLVLTVTCGVPGRSPGEPRGGADGKPYLQIASVTVEPSAIHISKNPGSATVTVLMIVRGDPQAGAAAQVEIGTYSTDPSGIKLRYPPSQSQVFKLQHGNTVVVVKFKTLPGPGTIPGKARIAVSYGPATKGIAVLDPVCPKAYIGELTVLP